MGRDVVLWRYCAHVTNRYLHKASNQQFSRQQLAKMCGIQNALCVHVAAADIIKVAPRIVGKVGGGAEPEVLCSLVVADVAEDEASLQRHSCRLSSVMHKGRNEAPIVRSAGPSPYQRLDQ
jgi:hypothetical protein